MGKNIAIMFGELSPKIIELLKSRLDDYTFEMFKDARDFIVRSGQQRNQFSRLVISPAALNKVEDLDILSEYMEEISVRTSVVFLLKRNTEKEYHSVFHKEFNSPLYTDMVVSSASDVEILKSVTSEIEDLRKEYSAFKIEDISLLEDTVEDEEDKTSPFAENFTIQRPMTTIPQVRPFSFLDKLANKAIKYSEKEKSILQKNNTTLKEFMNVLGNKGYSRFRNDLPEGKLDFYKKHNLIKVPTKAETTEKKIVKPKLYRKDFEQGLVSLINFNKEPNLRGSKFINRTGKPIQNT